MNPIQVIMSRMGGDFFSILVPGAYVLANVVLTVLSMTNNSSPGEWLSNLSQKISNEWPIALVILLISYLIGQIVHAFPVNRADSLCKRLFSRFVKRPWHKLLYESPFPYKATLEQTLHLIKKTRNIPLGDVFQDTDEHMHTTYNYWKLVLCLEEPAVFATAQSREARVRLYSGMFWSGVIGSFSGAISMSAVIVVFIKLSIIGEKFLFPWWYVGLSQLCASLILLSMFGYHLRRIRAQEVDTVFMGYLVHLEKIHRAENAVGS